MLNYSNKLLILLLHYVVLHLIKLLIIYIKLNQIILIY